MNKIFVILVFTLLGLSITGCSGHNAPKPYRVKLPINDGIKSDIRRKLLNKLIYNIANSQNYRSKNGCIQSSFYNPKISTCFRIDWILGNNILKRFDNESCTYHGDSIPCSYSENYLNLIKSIQSKDFPKKFKNLEDEWVIFDQEYKQKLKKLKKLKNETRIIINDKTNTISKEFLKKLESKTTPRYVVHVPNEYQKNISIYDTSIRDEELILFFNRGKIQNLDKLFRIEANVFYNRRNNETFNRMDHYNFYYDEIQALDLTSYNKKFIININRVTHNFLPSSFNFGDSNLEFYVENKRYEFNVYKLKVRNKTKEFITLNSIVVYYNGRNVSLPLNKNVTIPPMSSTELEATDDCTIRESVNGECERRAIYGNPVLDIVKKDMKVDYGFSVEYMYQNKKKTIYDIRKY